MELTVVNKYIGKDVIGYVVMTRISNDAKNEVSEIQARIAEKFKDSVYCLPKDSLHVTFMDWISPFAEYDKDKDVLFEEIFPNYNSALEKSIANSGAINVHFNAIEVYPDAIILIGQDGGKYNEIREKFVSEADLIKDAKKPPQIVHITICRFLKEVSVLDVKNFIKEITVDIDEKVYNFELIRVARSPLSKYSIVKKYDL
ncbi:MAG: hypothetical protein ACD_8C00138G0010 [uncultured bacterium]|nr:MAG: hypothetical protein ACD_8C00138G0010 [uncultured bacterium]